MITWRTQLVVDHRIAARIDAVIAERASTWGTLSATKLDNAIDTIVHAQDPDARRRLRLAVRDRDVQVGKPDDETGTASVFGRLLATDAALLDRRLAQMAGEVCEADPRTVGQRRSDAVGVMPPADTPWPVNAGRPSARPRARTRAPARSSSTSSPTGPRCPPNPLRSNPVTTPLHLNPLHSDLRRRGRRNLWPSPSPRRPPTAVVLGGGVIPTPLLAELVKGGAPVRSVRNPGPDATPGYRLSPRRERFVRMRDMTCRFPGCQRPAEYCNVDHTVPTRSGPPIRRTPNACAVFTIS